MDAVLRRLGATMFGGEELCCQGNQIGNILGNWKRTPSRVTSRACCRCLLQLCLHLQRWTSDFAWQGLGRSASCCWPSAEVDQDQRWAFHDMEKIGKPWQTHQGMQDFFWCFLKRDSISGLSDAWRMFHRHRNGIAYCEDKFAFEMLKSVIHKAGRFHDRLLLWLPKLSDGNIDWAAAEEFSEIPAFGKGSRYRYLYWHQQPAPSKMTYYFFFPSNHPKTIQKPIQKPSKNYPKPSKNHPKTIRNHPKTIGCSIWCLFSSDPSDLWRKEWRSSFKAGPRWGPAFCRRHPWRFVTALCKKEALDFIRKYKDIRYLYVL